MERRPGQMDEEKNDIAPVEPDDRQNRPPGVPPHQPPFDSEKDDLVDEESEESFPSSDPPSSGSPGLPGQDRSHPSSPGDERRSGRRRRPAGVGRVFSHLAWISCGLVTVDPTEPAMGRGVQAIGRGARRRARNPS